VHLADEKVHVIARVADQGNALPIARQIVRHTAYVEAKQELVWVLDVVEEGVAHGPVPVDTFEIQARGAGVPELSSQGVPGKEGAVRGDVVGNELPEDGESRRDTRVRERLVRHGEGRVHSRGRPPKPDRSVRVYLTGREIREHAPVLASERGLCVFDLWVQYATVSTDLGVLNHRTIPPLPRRDLLYTRDRECTPP
jgi:hypothetical protein